MLRTILIIGGFALVAIVILILVYQNSKKQNLAEQAAIEAQKTKQLQITNMPVIKSEAEAELKKSQLHLSKWNTIYSALQNAVKDGFVGTTVSVSLDGEALPPGVALLPTMKIESGDLIVSKTIANKMNKAANEIAVLKLAVDYYGAEVEAWKTKIKNLG